MMIKTAVINPLKIPSGKSQEFDFNELFESARTSNELSRSLDSPSTESLLYDHNTNEDELPERDEQGNFSINYEEPIKKLCLEDFTLLTLVGKGGFGKVFVAQKKKDNKEVYAIKVLKKDFLIKTNNVNYTRTERDILRKVRHPNIVSLHYAFQTQGKVYLVMDLLLGGPLYFHMSKERMFSEEQVRFYAGEIILALAHLHSLGIIHRDLKPENILLDSQGHVNLTDFGLAKEDMGANDKTGTFCGTIEYMAPEMISGQGYGKEADWWSLGILIYDMLVGHSPFSHKNRKVLEDKIMKDKIKMPDYLTGEAITLVKGLLERNVKKRLCSGSIDEIKRHPFFKTLNWKKLINGDIPVPIKPHIEKDIDTRNFDAIFTSQAPVDSPFEGVLSPNSNNLFKGFSYVRSPDFE